MNTPQRQNGSGCCGATADNRAAGFTCLPNWLFGQATAQELVVLLALQHHAPNIHPSLAMLAHETGLGRSTVCRVLTGLKARGWLRTEQRRADDGGNSSTAYHLLIWADEPSPAPAPLVPERDNPLSRSGMGVVPERDTNKKDLTRRNPTALEPPSPPTGERRPSAAETDPCRDLGRPWAADRDRDGFLISPVSPQQPQAPEEELQAPEQPEPQPEATQPQPQQPNAPMPAKPAETPRPAAPVNPKGQKRRAGFSPDHGDVPAALLPVVRELLAFWPARRGAKTPAAWQLLCRELQRIQDHPQGGTEIVRDQLEQGAMAGIDGRAWQSIRFSNWLQFGTKAVTPVIGSGFQQRRMTPEESAAAAVAYIRARDAREQALSAAESVLAAPVLAEVAA